MRTMIVIGLLLIGALAYLKQHHEYQEHLTGQALFEVQFNKADKQTDEYSPSRNATHYSGTEK